MPLIQNDLQPLDDARRPELRKRAVVPTVSATGSPDPYVRVVIRESGPSNLAEARGWGPYDRRELIAEEYSEPAPPPGAIIVGLFLLQRLGTGAVGRLFGPVMGIWFAAIGAIGVHGVAAHPEILKALLATYALDFLAGHFSTAFFSLAAVVLAVTGAGALGAGHRRFLNCGKATTPLAMRANVEHDQVLHEHVLILSIETMPVPHVPAAEGLEIDGLVYKDDRIVHITAASATWTNQTCLDYPQLSVGPGESLSKRHRPVGSGTCRGIGSLSDAVTPAARGERELKLTAGQGSAGRLSS